MGVTTDKDRSKGLPTSSTVVISDPINAAKAILADIKKNSKYKGFHIIALTHIGWERDVELANDPEAAAISIIIGGHSHTGIGGIQGGPLGKDKIPKTLSLPYPYMITRKDGSKICMAQAGFRCVNFP